MAEITIIPSVRLYKTGLKTTQADGNTRSIALRQGSLDGACAVYSTIIALMCLRQINYEDVDTSNGNIDKRSLKGRFLSKLLEQRGMNMQGWNLKTLAQEINNTSTDGQTDSNDENDSSNENNQEANNQNTENNNTAE